MKLQFNKTILYSQKRKHTLIMGLVFGFLLSMLLIFLRPFRITENNTVFLNLKLIGYTFCVLIPILIMNPLENYVYKKQKKRWYIYNEVFYILSCLSIMLITCFMYSEFIVNQKENTNIKTFFEFVYYFELPFLPIFIPIWLFLRSYFGNIKISNTKTLEQKRYSIRGENKSETFSLGMEEFIYAKAQQNYVDIIYKTEKGISHKMIRSTLSNLIEQLPDYDQIHRSYLVNLHHLKTVEGNARKRVMKFNVSVDPIPVSQKYYELILENKPELFLKLQIQH